MLEFLISPGKSLFNLHKLTGTVCKVQEGVAREKGRGGPSFLCLEKGVGKGKSCYTACLQVLMETQECLK